MKWQYGGMIMKSAKASVIENGVSGEKYIEMKLIK
jgi:hypothetical protein